MSIKIKGLDQLQRQLSDAQRALEQMDGTLGTLTFDPADPASVQAAIRQMEQMVDSKVAAHRSNPLVAQVAAAAKAKFRQSILARARGQTS